MKIVSPRSLALIVASVLAGCATSQIPGPGPLLVPSANGEAPKPASFLYLAQCCGGLFSNHGAITLYDLGLTGISRTITKGVLDPRFITVDRAGRIYVTSYDYLRGVTEYDAGSERPSRRIELPNAWAAATDVSNNLYAAACPMCHEYEQGKGSIDVYQAGTTKLLRSIQKGIDTPSALVLDTMGNLYVLNQDGAKTAVLVYAPGSSIPARKLAQGPTEAFAIALDSSNNLFVMRNGYSSSPPSIVEYQAGSNKVVRTITKGLASPQAMTFDGSGTLYVSNTPYPSQGWVSVYAPGASTPGYRIKSGMHDPQLLAVDAKGNLYVGNDYYAVALDHPDSSSSTSGSVCAYAPKARKPMRCDQNSPYSYPYSLAVNPR